VGVGVGVAGLGERAFLGRHFLRAAAWAAAAAKASPLPAALAWAWASAGGQGVGVYSSTAAHQVQVGVCCL
jgi:hypothetical protein